MPWSGHRGSVVARIICSASGGAQGVADQIVEQVGERPQDLARPVGVEVRGSGQYRAAEAVGVVEQPVEDVEIGLGGGALEQALGGGASNGGIVKHDLNNAIFASSCQCRIGRAPGQPPSWSAPTIRCTLTTSVSASSMSL